MKAKIILLVLTFTLLLTCDIFSQTISITSISKTQFCVGDEFTVDFVASGTFEDDNVFVVQLSYPDGNFNNFNNIGNLKSKNSGSINCKIPDNLSTNLSYRIRIISSKPYLQSQDNGYDIPISTKPNPDFSIKPQDYDGTYVLTGQSVSFTNTTSENADFYWNFGEDAVPPEHYGKNPPPVVYNSSGKKRIVLKATNVAGCSKSKVIDNKDNWYNQLNVYDCFPKIPENAVVINKKIQMPGTSQNVWVCSNGILDKVGGGLEIIFVETGGTINFNAGGSETVYLKPGACINGYFPGVVIKAPGSSINCNNEDIILNCDFLEFNYVEAPEEGKIAQHLAVDDNSMLNNLSIFPNPSDGLINISLNSEVPSFSVTVYDVLGKEIYFENVNNIAGTWNNKIDLSGYSKGMYFIKILGLEQSIIRSLILR